MLQQIFDSFDVDKKGNIGVDMIGQILDMLGHQLTADELQVSPRKAHYQILFNYFRYSRLLYQKSMQTEMER